MLKNYSCNIQETIYKLQKPYSDANAQIKQLTLIT